ncbi:MAG TPA: sigma-70 family RNA polymerase sigma factor [Verrucomicrobiae bacterium]
MNDQTDTQLLRAYAEKGSEPAFSELVRRHMDLVYSAALRMVCDSHLAQDVTQGAFVALAKSAGQLADHPVLSGWLHRTAQNIAAQTVRTDVRRRAREQEASAMKELLSAENDASWEDIAPHLDAALGDLSEPDRDAVMLRYFERKSAKEMAQTLGISDEAAQKRVSRAVDRLRDSFAQRGVKIGASGLVLLITANAVQAAPAGLVLTISASALSSTATATAATTVTTTVTQTIAMTTFQKLAVTTALTATIGALIYEHRQVTDLRNQNTALHEHQVTMQEQLAVLQRERDTATKRQNALLTELAEAKKGQTNNEVLRLRGEVGVLRRDNETIGKKSAINKITSDPATRKMMQSQQKMGMKALFSEFAKKQKLETETSDQFNELLANGIMDNIDLITQSLQDKNSLAEINRIFNAQDKILDDQLLTLLGKEGFEQYQAYSKDLITFISAEQFQANLTGDKEAKTAKKEQFSQLMREETKAALAAAGLPADYQVVPMLNLRNIASEQQTDISLKLLDDIYARVSNRATFLNTEEQEKFTKFRKEAQDNSRAMLLMNRSIMAPIAK